MKNHEEIKQRIEHLKNTRDDFFGFHQAALKIWIPEYYIEEHQHECPDLTKDAVHSTITDYLEFAFDKAINHRGISTSRSVEKLSEWAWILDRSDLVDFTTDRSNYQNYGVPILKKFAKAFGVELPEDIRNWIDGEPCEPGCTQGCDKS
jgi:hypothetical protein